MQTDLIIICNGDKLLHIYFQSITSDLTILYIPHNFICQANCIRVSEINNML